MIALTNAQYPLNWNKDVPVGQPHSMNCTQGQTGAKFNESEWNKGDPTWILPSSFKKVSNGWSDDEKNRQVTDDGMTFKFEKVQPDFYGAYHCVVTLVDGTQVLFKHGLNLTKYTGSLWERYRMGTIIGGGAAGAFLALVIIIFFVYKYRWVPPKEEPYNGAGGTTHVNKAFVAEDLQYDAPVAAAANNNEPSAATERPSSANVDLTKV